jgi:hypothetical protein
MYSPAPIPILLPWVLLGSLCGVVAVSYGFAATRCNPHRWKIALACLMMASIATCTNFFLVAFSSYGASLLNVVIATVAQWGTAVVALAVVVAATIDYFQATRRDWLHWLGVATYLATAAIELFNQLIYA